MGSTSLPHKLVAIVYLHALRTWRYKYGFINAALTMFLWVAIYVLGVIIFMPNEKLGEMMPHIFWGIVAWNIMTFTVLYTAGWTIWFVVNVGLVEELMLHNTSIALFLSGRLITVAGQTAIMLPLLYMLVRHIAGQKPSLVKHPLLLVYGLATMAIMALSYGLLLAALGLRLNIPGTLLDVTDFLLFLIGGIAAPVAMLPEPIRWIAIATPYSHAVEIIRYGATGLEPYLGLRTELILSALIAAAMFAAAYAVHRWVEESYIRRHGVKGVGRM
ncbi:ABC transporter permease [Hyperthermus butylicus]|uniref:ABC-2 type transporter transmembrane domain-containing protein n=1 Tax=Hyperthermus butylicus (strain DSM 5456 / JCM 9403 / PLM1-5) TaxID=415426 RepID=A2BMQ0_HYPBU|nr:ABC transporter permease [Hyperthermus butylicus]ABM81261.1 hypothetical protein Hbut_1437 [Hyperthermus butylicus DSM 5456]